MQLSVCDRKSLHQRQISQFASDKLAFIGLVEVLLAKSFSSQPAFCLGTCPLYCLMQVKAWL